MPAKRAPMCNSTLCFAVTLYPAGRLWLWRRGRRRMARRIGEEAEEFGFRPQQEASVVGTKPGLIGRHRAVEGEEFRILAIGLGEQPVAFGVANAAGLLGGRIGIGDNDSRFTIGLGANLLRLLTALGSEFLGLALTF